MPLTASAAQSAWRGARVGPSTQEPQFHARSLCSLGQRFSIGVADSRPNPRAIVRAMAMN